MIHRFLLSSLASGMLLIFSTSQATPVLPAPVPAQGQSSAQMASDKTACYAEAKARTGYDPNAAPIAAANTAPEPVDAKGRVKSSAKRSAGGAAAGAAIGAIAGDAGKGAAIGAAVGGVSGVTQNNKGAVGGSASGAAMGAAAGAIAGDAGKGAAIGAAAGAVGGAAKKANAKRQANNAQKDANAANEAALQAYYDAFGACLTARGYTLK